MKRLGRWLFNLAVIASGATCIGCMAIAIASFVHPGTVEIHAARIGFYVQNTGGPLRIFARRSMELPTPMSPNLDARKSPAHDTIRSSPTLDEPAAHSFLGFGIGPGRKEAAMERAIAQRFRLVSQQFMADMAPDDPRRRIAAVAGLHRLDLSIWRLLLLSAVLPALWLKRFVTHRRSSLLGNCKCCGYDLRATPERCPECGAVPATATKVAT